MIIFIIILDKEVLVLAIVITMILLIEILVTLWRFKHDFADYNASDEGSNYNIGDEFRGDCNAGIKVLMMMVTTALQRF